MKNIFSLFSKMSLTRGTLHEGLAAGHAEGLAEGEARFAKLTEKLLQSNHMDDLTKSLTDLGYRAKLYKQYNL
ncbi:MAG: hypothetical protein HDR06_13375 [Lachnospiraceae bacterium]|nr:hypothetical protein [Lachnospiraceae bacterium]